MKSAPFLLFITSHIQTSSVTVPDLVCCVLDFIFYHCYSGYSVFLEAVPLFRTVTFEVHMVVEDCLCCMIILCNGFMKIKMDNISAVPSS